MPALHLATFECDVTPPLGHPLCGGWIEPARAVDDPLKMIGVALLGAGAPVVLAAVDWCGVRNEANLDWRQAIANAAHTVPDNVAIHCVHPHNAPFADTEAERLLESVPGAPPALDLKFFDHVVNQSADGVKESLKKTHRFTHIGIGQAKVEQVASNRRVIDPDGKVKYTRTSATKEPLARAEPEGLIDPCLKTLSFWDGDQPLAALHYYATHPMSYYGDGRVSSDFCGLAREKRRRDDGAILHAYFTGCAGNITAGKYNDGSKENRPILRDRIYDAMVAAWKATARYTVSAWDCRVELVKLKPRLEKSFGEEESKKTLLDDQAPKAKRGNAAFQLAWLKRIDRPIPINCLDFGPVQVLHLPGEPFIEFQLKAQQLGGNSFVCVAGYGDGGPGYIPTQPAFFEGGYEPTVALSSPETEPILYRTMEKLLRLH